MKGLSFLITPPLTYLPHVLIVIINRLDGKVRQVRELVLPSSRRPRRRRHGEGEVHVVDETRVQEHAQHEEEGHAEEAADAHEDRVHRRRLLLRVLSWRRVVPNALRLRRRRMKVSDIRYIGAGVVYVAAQMAKG